MRRTRIFPEQSDFADRASAFSGAVAAFFAVTGVVVHYLSGGGSSGFSQVYLTAAAFLVVVAGFSAIGLGAFQWFLRNKRTAGFTATAHWGFWLGVLALRVWIVNTPLPPAFG